MTDRDFALTRRSVMFVTVASLLQTGTLVAGEKQVITVHKDPTCGCCSGWVEHLQRAGFETKVLDTKDLDGVKQLLGVPEDLAACHTAEVSTYVVEGHVPAAALKRFLAEKPTATGLAVPACRSARPAWRGALPNHMKWFCLGPLAVALTCG